MDYNFCSVIISLNMLEVCEMACAVWILCVYKITGEVAVAYSVAGHGMEWKMIFPYSIWAVFYHSISINYTQNLTILFFHTQNLTRIFLHFFHTKIFFHRPIPYFHTIETFRLKILHCMFCIVAML